MSKNLFIVCLLLVSMSSHAQFAPQAGLTGSTALYKDSSIFVDWGSDCSIERGWMDVSNTSLGITSQGTISDAINKADGNTVSLGDGGEAIYFLENPITNETGFDFAIFENGFRNPLDSSMAYLELATVSVSNDGINYFQFSVTCSNDTLTQIAGAGDYMNASHVLNLAGKYIANYGTPFELDDLNSVLSLDLNAIHYIKIKDVVGTLAESYCSKDQYAHKINDPYPTPFASGGFDLDALGIIHHKYVTNSSSFQRNNIVKLYPNPTNGILNITCDESISTISIFDLQGEKIHSYSEAKCISIADLKSGIYNVVITLKSGHVYKYLIQKSE